MVVKQLAVATALTILASCAIGAKAEARTRHHHHRHHHHHNVDANGNVASLFATVHTATGLTARVIASARDKFQGFIEALESDGHKISDIGCLSRGHMRNSKHHWGGACDIDQTDRNRTSGFMYHVTAIAHRFGLVDGCEWSDRDCGHIEVPGPNTAYRNPSYRMAMK